MNVFNGILARGPLLSDGCRGPLVHLQVTTDLPFEIVDYVPRFLLVICKNDTIFSLSFHRLSASGRFLAFSMDTPASL